MTGEALTPSSWQGRVDLDSLLVALVLVPHSYPRNRFYQLFRDPDAYRVRRRAALLRSLIADLSGDADKVTIERRDGGVSLSYLLVDVSVQRTTFVDERELELVTYAVSRHRPRADLPASEVSSASFATVLERLYSNEPAE